MKKYEFTGEIQEFEDCTLHRIRALCDFECHGIQIKAGDIGGWIETEENLSHDGGCWVADEAMVCYAAEVRGEALVRGYAVIEGAAVVSDQAIVCEQAMVGNGAEIRGQAIVGEQAVVSDLAVVSGQAVVIGHAYVGDEAVVGGRAVVSGRARVSALSDYLTVGPIGSRHETTTFYRTADGGIGASCGCFVGTIDKFAAEVNKPHGGIRYEGAYTAAIELAKAHFVV